MSQIMIDRVGDVVVSCSIGALSFQDVERVASEIEQSDTRVYLAGANGDVAMDPASRNMLYRVLRKRNIEVVAVTDSKIVRGIITAAAWMGVQVLSKSWEEVSESPVDPKAVQLLMRQRQDCH